MYYLFQEIIDLTNLSESVDYPNNSQPNVNSSQGAQSAQSATTASSGNTFLSLTL